MNWYKIAKLIDPQIQEQFLQWGKAQGLPIDIIRTRIQELIELEKDKRPELTPRAYEQSTWVTRQFGKFIKDYKNIPVQQRQVQQESPIIRKAKGINQNYYQWILEVWKQNPTQTFDQSIFDYFAGANINPLNPFIMYDNALTSSNLWHEERYHDKEQKRYTTPVTDGEPINDMFMVELTKEDEEAEGINMQNCIGDMCHVSPNNYIYSLRDKNNNPHVSIEVNNGDVTQVRGKQNEFPTSKYVDYVALWLSKHTEIKIGEIDEFPGFTEKQLLLLVDNMDADSLLENAVITGSWVGFNEAIKRKANNFDRALTAAAWKGRTDFVKYLTENMGANIFVSPEKAYSHTETVFYDNEDIEHFEVLNQAISEGHIDVVKYFIQKFKDSWLKGRSLLQYLHQAIRFDRFDTIKLLIDEGLVPITEKTQLVGLLYYVKSVNSLMTLKKLIPEIESVINEDLNDTDLMKILFIRHRDADLIRFFINNGLRFDKNYFSSNKKLDSHFNTLAMNGKTELLNILMENDPNLKSWRNHKLYAIEPHSLNKYCLALQAAIEAAKIETVRFLVDNNIPALCKKDIFNKSIKNLRNKGWIPEEQKNKMIEYIEESVGYKSTRVY